MRGKSKILLLLVLVIAALGIAGLALLVPFSASSEVSPYEYRVSTLRANWYLLANGYRHKYGGVRITLTSEAQSGYRHTGKGDMVFQSVSAVTEGDTLDMRVQYDPVQIANYESGRVSGSYTRDLYMYLCLAMQGDNPELAQCYARADAQIERERWLPGEAARVVRYGETGWRLVGQAHAQSCVGQIQCGGITTAGYCSDDVTKSCTTGGVCNSGICIGGGQSRCDTSLNPINCNTLTDKAQCETQGYVSNCALGCNTSAENFCSWGTGDGLKPEFNKH